MKTNDADKREEIRQDKKNLQSETWGTFRKGISRQNKIKHFTAGQAEDNQYGDVWGEIVQEYLKTRYGRENSSDAACGISVRGITYQVMERKKRDITVFYDASGDTLFDVTNERLESEYRQQMKQKKSSETGKTYSSGAEKLRDEESRMMESVKPEYKAVIQGMMDALFHMLIEKVQTDPEFEAKVLLPHKNMGRCMRFCADKASGIREPSEQEKEAARKYNIPIMTPVGSDMVLEWILEYYARDDKAEVEKEEKQKTSKKQGRTKSKKNAESKAEENEQESRRTPKTENKKEPKGSAAKNGGIENQMSLFDLMGV